MEAVLEDALLLLHEKKISNMKDLCCRCSSRWPSGQAAAASIAEDIDGEALATLVVNKIRGTLQRAPR